MAKKRKSEPFSDQLRRCIVESGLGIRPLVRLVEDSYGDDAQADPGQLNNFLAGRRGLSLETIDQLAAVLGLEITMRSAKRKGE